MLTESMFVLNTLEKLFRSNPAVWKYDPWNTAKGQLEEEGIVTLPACKVCLLGKSIYKSWRACLCYLMWSPELRSSVELLHPTKHQEMLSQPYTQSTARPSHQFCTATSAVCALGKLRKAEKAELVVLKEKKMPQKTRNPSIHAKRILVQLNDFYLCGSSLYLLMCQIPVSLLVSVPSSCLKTPQTERWPSHLSISSWPSKVTSAMPKELSSLLKTLGAAWWMPLTSLEP